MGTILQFPIAVQGRGPADEQALRHILKEEKDMTPRREDALVECWKASLASLPQLSISLNTSSEGWPSSASEEDRQQILAALQSQIEQQIYEQLRAMGQHMLGELFRLHQELYQALGKLV